jgi:hypothetical protein
MAGIYQSTAIRIGGAAEYMVGFAVAGNGTLTYDFTVQNDSGAGTLHKVSCGFVHNETISYGAVLDGLFMTRATGINVLATLYSNGTGNGGTFSVSKPSVAVLRVYKSAGTYGGVGYGFIKVTTY